MKICRAYIDIHNSFLEQCNYIYISHSLVKHLNLKPSLAYFLKLRVLSIFHVKVVPISNQARFKGEPGGPHSRSPRV